MQQIIELLAFLRNQLVMQQSLINESISRIDSTLMSEIQIHSQNEVKITNIPKQRNFPKGIYSKRDKLKHILKEANMPLTVKEIKKILLSEYNESLPNVDQSLVNMEASGLIFSKNDIGRKQYFIK